MTPHNPDETVKTFPEMTLDELQSLLKFTLDELQSLLEFVEHYRQILEDRKAIKISTK